MSFEIDKLPTLAVSRLHQRIHPIEAGVGPVGRYGLVVDALRHCAGFCHCFKHHVNLVGQ